MRLCKVFLLTALIVVMPVFSACGTNEAENTNQRAYDQALREYQERMAIYQEQREIYQKELEEAYGEYAKELGIWYEQQQKQAEELIKQIPAN